MKLRGHNLSEVGKDYTMMERRSATLEPGFTQQTKIKTGGYPIMYKSKPRFQVSWNK